MAPYRIDFREIEWESPMEGIRQKVYQSDKKQIRLVEYNPQMEPHWCEKGHYGFILSGRFEIEFDDGTRIFESGEGVFIPPGKKHRHKGRVFEGTVVALFVEDLK